MYKLSDQLYFPPVETAHPSGIVAFGGDLSAERLVLAYQSGIFLGLKTVKKSRGLHRNIVWCCF